MCVCVCVCACVCVCLSVCLCVGPPYMCLRLCDHLRSSYDHDSSNSRYSEFYEKALMNGNTSSRCGT